jgi:hypothetical protein
MKAEFHIKGTHREACAVSIRETLEAAEARGA